MSKRRDLDRMMLISAAVALVFAVLSWWVKREAAQNQQNVQGDRAIKHWLEDVDGGKPR